MRCLVPSQSRSSVVRLVHGTSRSSHAEGTVESGTGSDPLQPHTGSVGWMHGRAIRTRTSVVTCVPRSASSSPAAGLGSLPSRPACRSSAPIAAGSLDCAAKRSAMLAGISSRVLRPARARRCDRRLRGRRRRDRARPAARRRRTRPSPRPAPRRQQQPPPAAPRPAIQRVRPTVQRIMDSMAGTPAFVINGRLDSSASNELGRALYAPIYDEVTDPPNNARFIFLDPARHRVLARLGQGRQRHRRDAAHRGRPRSL